MAIETILARIADNPRLPTPPAIALQVLDRASKPSCTIAEIARIISLDPGLCGKLLKLVNSALFGLPRAVSSIERALNLLGLNRVRSLVLSLTMPTLKFKNANQARMRDYWKVSVTEAIVARSLVRSLTGPTRKLKMAIQVRVRHSWKVAVPEGTGAREMDARLHWPDPDSEMVAGLLSDLGILILQEAFPEQYVHILAYP